MKKNYLLAIGLLCAMIGTAGCAKTTEVPDYSTPASDAIAFNCHSTWGEENELTWVETSQIGLFCEKTKAENEALGVTALTANLPLGSFYTKTAWNEGEYEFFLYSPYAQSNKTTMLSGTIPSLQSQIGISVAHIDQNALLCATVKGTRSAKPLDVELKQVFNYLDASIITAKWRGWIPEQLTITAPEGFALVGGYLFDMKTNEFTLDENKSNVLNLNLSGVELAGGPLHVYMLTAPFTTAADVECDATLKIARDGKKSKALIGKVKILSGAQTQSVVELLIDLDTYKDESIDDTSIDLCDPNETGVPVTANCYVAGLAGQEYRFSATVMGNGYTTPATPAYEGGGKAEGITPKALDPKSAKLLWQTDPTLISGVKLKNKQVYFTLNGTLDNPTDLTEGNAVIAVYSGENGTGDILWSWHIWVTAADLNATVQTYTLPGQYADAGNPVLMDRNLGALKSGMWGTNKDNFALGLMYQWGRKDPFLNIDDSTIGANGALAIGLTRKTYDAMGTMLPVDNTAISSTAFAPEKWLYFFGKTIPQAEIARYPMNFGHLVATTNWIDEVTDDLWGNAFSETIGEVGHKSIYDPCPPGYRVPHRYFATFTTTDGEATTNKNPTDLARWKGQYTTQAEIQAAGGNVFDSGAFPLGGMLFISSNKIVPFRVGTYVGHYQVTMPALKPNNSYRFYIDHGNIKPTDNNARYIGGNVRCMKE